MTSEPIRDPLIDHLLTPQNSAAVSNAIYDAVGVRVRDFPFRPDRVLGALQTRATAQG